MTNINPFETVKVTFDDNYIDVYHRCMLSINEDDTSHFRYLKKYGLISLRDRENKDLVYLKNGVYFACKNNEKDDSFNNWYGRWIIKCKIPYKDKFFIIDYKLFRKLGFNANIDEYLTLQFDEYGVKYKPTYKHIALITSNMYYKLYREIEPLIDKIRHKLNGMMFYNFNYSDSTDTKVLKNKFIDKYQVVVYKGSLIRPVGIKWANNRGDYDKFEFKCRDFNLDTYMKKIKTFSKKTTIKDSDIDNFDKDYLFNPGIYHKSIHNNLEAIYSKLSNKKLKELKSILPKKLLMPQFNPGIELINNNIYHN